MTKNPIEEKGKGVAALLEGADADFRNVPLSEIKPDPNQPRKFYDNAAMEELTNSVREKGVLQPIVIRPNGKGYLLVCGERRYRAALSVNAAFKERNLIPAVIRQLNDDEALELQIIENLQRKDVHPMEEAVAIKSMLENKAHPYTVEDIAAKLAKNVYYVRQRNRLNTLSKEWQEIFFKGHVTISDALLVSGLQPDDQNTVFKNCVRKGELKNDNYRVQIYSNYINQLQRKLKDAPFDTKDETLNPKMGACTGCPFNSAVNSLFPDDAKNPVCNNAACFEVKKDCAFKIALKAAIEDPEIVLVYNYTNGNEERNLVANLKKDGNAVYERGETFVDSDHWNYKKTPGVELKGFNIAGHDRGQYVKVKLLSKASAVKAAAKKKGSNDKLNAADLENEIQRLKKNQTRALELDEQKIWNEVKPLLSAEKLVNANTGPLRPEEREAIAYAMHDKLGYGGTDRFRKHFKIDGRSMDFSKVDDKTLVQMMRFFFLEILPPSQLYSGFNGQAKTCMKVATLYLPEQTKAIVDKQNEIAAKRIERSNKAIKNCQDQKKELAKPKEKKATPAAATKKPAGKKTAAKKPAKKASSKKSSPKKK